LYLLQTHNQKYKSLMNALLEGNDDGFNGFLVIQGNQLSYSTVVLYIGIMKVWGFWPEIITLKPA